MTQAEQAQAIINHHRRSKGLRPLRRATDLTNAALAHARDMAANDFFDHRNFRDRWPKTNYEGAGEVIHYQSWRPESHKLAVESWMKSPKHYDILMGDFTHLGLGRVYDKPQGIIYWVGMTGRAK